MIRTILAALEGSPLAEYALAHACRLARQTGAAVVLVRAAPFATISENLAAPASGTVREAELYLDTARERLAREGLTVRAEALHGDAARAIVAAAQAQGADLIAMGTHGRSGLRQVLLGSVAQEVLHRTTLPLLLVRADEPPAEVGTGPYRTILVPLDGSPSAEAALSYLEQAGLDRAATLVLLRAVSPFTIPVPVGPMMGSFSEYPPGAVLGPSEADSEADRQAALDYLDHLVEAQLQGRTCRIVVRRDDPAKAILETAAEEGVELIVMATHGRAGLDRLLRGSVAQHVLHHTPVPLLLLHRAANAPAADDAAVAHME